MCKTAPALVYEAMECLGGNGYVEDGTLARLYREAPVNAIWEGSGNVMGLDVLRAFAREPEAAARRSRSSRARRTACPARPKPPTVVGKVVADPAAEAIGPAGGRAAGAACGGRGTGCERAA